MDWEKYSKPPALESGLPPIGGDQVRCFSLCTQPNSLWVNKIKANKRPTVMLKRLPVIQPRITSDLQTSVQSGPLQFSSHSRPIGLLRQESSFFFTVILHLVQIYTSGSVNS